ncbi:MAG: hypothetical protein HYZ46_04195 [Nitrosomonadales bacterium]|nr:hypothetical protein [Nitrosomonadales bacterium]
MISSIGYLPNTAAASAQAQADVASSNAVLPNNQSDAIASLSSLGRVRSTLAELQDRATALKTLNNPPTFTDFQAVVQSFVQSFNALNKAVNDTTANAKQVAQEPDKPAKQALNEVRNATLGGSAASALQSLGVSQQGNGSLLINSAQLKKGFLENRSSAVSTLADLSNRVSLTVGKQLPDSGTLGRAVNEVRAPVPGNARSAVTSYAAVEAF